MTIEARRRTVRSAEGNAERRSGGLIALVLAGCLFGPALARAQIPDAPETFDEPDGTIDDLEEVDPVGGEGAPPDAARDTIEEMNNARERASGTPEPEPTP